MTLGDFVVGSVVGLAGGRRVRLAWTTTPFDKRKDPKVAIDGVFVEDVIEDFEGTRHSSPTWLAIGTAVVEVVSTPDVLAGSPRPQGAGSADVDPLRDAARLGPLFAEAPSSIDNDDGGPR